MDEADLQLECEIVQRSVDVFRNETTPWEAFFRARQTLSQISVFHWDMIEFDDVAIRVTPKAKQRFNGRLSGLQSV